MSVLLDRAGIAALIPHAGTMCLWDELIEADAGTAQLRTQSHRDTANPLRHDGQLAALHLIEYGAQAMAVHGGWLARTGGGDSARAGVLAAVRDIELLAARIDDIAAPLQCRARRLLVNAGGSMYEFELSAGPRLLGRGRASVIQAAG